MIPGIGLQLLLFALGAVVLYFGAQGFIRGASRLAETLGVSRLAIGLTIVAFGTSAPEMANVVMASVTGRDLLAVGNIAGANIANLGLVLGVGTVLRSSPLMISGVKREVFFLIGVSILFYLLVIDKELGRIDGAIFLGIFGVYLWWWLRRRADGVVELQGTFPEAALTPTRGKVLAITWDVVQVAGGILILVGGARLMINAAVEMAAAFGVSQGVIGLSLVAFGTTLPELATTIVGTFRREYDIVVGNIVGSCVFNVLAILGIGALLNPLEIEPGWLFVEIPVMVGFTLALVPLVLRKAGHILRWEGGLLLLGYFAFIAWIYR
ncbi:MAG: calcium/sodium antiporter [Chloroflexi bacterium]|nr:calcium/sodium antiporter [Chloroflexota bacterium]